MSAFKRRIYKLMHRPPDTPFERAQKAPTRFVFDYTLAMSIYFVVVNTLMAKLTAYYELSVGLSTMIVTLPALLTAVEFLSNRYFRHLRKFAVVWRLMLPTVVGSVLLPKQVGSIVMIIAFFIMCLSYHIYLPSYNAYTVNVTQGHIRSNYFSSRDSIFLPAFILLSYLFAAIVSRAEQAGDVRQGFFILVIIEIAFLAPSLWLLLHCLPNPTAPLVSHTGEVQQSKADTASKGAFRKEIKEVLADRSYRKVLVFHVVWVFFFQFSGFLSVYQIQVLQQDYLLVSIYGVIGNTIRFLLLPVFAFVGVKYGWKKVIYICLGIMSMGISCWVLINESNLWLLFPAGNILMNIPWAGLGIGMFYFQIACTKMQTRSMYFSVHAGVVGTVATLGVICCNALVSALSQMQTPPYQIVFFLWLFGAIATFFLVLGTPFPKEEPVQDSLAQQEEALEQELAAERAAAAQEQSQAVAAQVE